MTVRVNAVLSRSVLEIHLTFSSLDSMQSFTLLILFSTFLHSSALECLKTADENSMEFDMIIDDIEDVIGALEGLSMDDDDDHKMCRIQLSIDYDTGWLELILTNNLTHSILNSENVRIEILVVRDSMNKTIIQHHLEYACSNDQCDLEFVKKYLESLMNAERSQRADAITPYIVGDDDGQKGKLLIRYNS